MAWTDLPEREDAVILQMKPRPPNIADQLRLDDDTRSRGLSRLALIRKQMELSAAQRKVAANLEDHR